MDFRESTEKLNKIYIQDIAVFLGIKLPIKGSSRCPFPDHEDKRASFEIKSSGIRWICYGCNRRGGSIDFVKEYNEMDFKTAKQWLKEKMHHGISDAPVFRGIPKKKNQELVKSNNSCNSGNYTDVYDFLLTLTPLLESGSNYLQSRKITHRTMSAFRIAQMPTKSILQKLLNKFGFDRINASGLLTKKSTTASPQIIFPLSTVLFPFFEDGKVVYLQARALEGGEKYGKWRNLNSQPRRIYNVDAILQNSKRPFAICEGVIDTLSAIELGYNAVGMMGVSAKFTPEQIRKLRMKEVQILLDWDEPGETRAKDLQEELYQYGVVSIRKELPSKKATDLNEYLSEIRMTT